MPKSAKAMTAKSKASQKHDVKAGLGVQQHLVKRKADAKPLDVVSPKGKKKNAMHGAKKKTK